MPLTHFDAEGKARMVDVTEKKETVREATATGKIKVSRDVYDAIEAGIYLGGKIIFCPALDYLIFLQIKFAHIRNLLHHHPQRLCCLYCW